MGRVKLTAKQEKFIQEIVKGKSQRQAYIASYNTSKWKDTSIDRMAHKLFHNINIVSRYGELMKKHTDKAIMERGELLEGLKNAFYMALGTLATPISVREVIEGRTEFSEFRVKEADLKSVSAIAGQIAKLEGWDKQTETEKDFNVNISLKGVSDG